MPAMAESTFSRVPIDSVSAMIDDCGDELLRCRKVCLITLFHGFDGFDGFGSTFAEHLNEVAKEEGQESKEAEVKKEGDGGGWRGPELTAYPW